MKKRKIWAIFFTLTIVISMFSGCGKTAEETVQEVNNVNESEDNENAPENEGADESRTPEKSFSDNTEELEGMVQRVGENTVLISRIFSEKSEEDGLYYAFSPGEGSEEEELLTVSVTDNTKYQVRTIKNSGEDVTEREGEFADIKKDYIIKVTGNIDDAGEEIMASEIVIMEIL